MKVWGLSLIQDDKDIFDLVVMLFAFSFFVALDFNAFQDFLKSSTESSLTANAF